MYPMNQPEYGHHDIADLPLGDPYFVEVEFNHLLNNHGTQEDQIRIPDFF